MKTTRLKLIGTAAILGAALAATAQTSPATPPADNSAGDVPATQNIGNFVPVPLADPTPNNFTNPIVIPTVEFYQKNQAAIIADQQSRVQGNGPVHGATALQPGPRIEPHPPSSYLTTDPWVEQDHPWDFVNNPDTTSP